MADAAGIVPITYFKLHVWCSAVEYRVSEHLMTMSWFVLGATITAVKPLLVRTES